MHANVLSRSAWRVWLVQVLALHARLAALHARALAFLRSYPAARGFRRWRARMRSKKGGHP